MSEHGLYDILYVIVSAITEFLPVSPRAHQMLFEVLTGVTMTDPVVSLVIHLGCAIAVAVACGPLLRRLSVGKRIEKRSKKGRQRDIDRTAIFDGRVVRAVSVPLTIGSLLYPQVIAMFDSLLLLSVTSVLGGCLLFLPQFMLRGNKDSRTFSRLDCLCMSLGGIVAVIPGFSRIGGVLSVGTTRGGRFEHLTEIALVSSIPVLIVYCVFDVIAIASGGIVLTIWSVLWYLLLGMISFIIAYLGTLLLRFLSAKTDLVSFSFYSWGLGLTSFILYLMI